MATCPICLGPARETFHSTGRQLVADVCNHAVAVHNAGPIDAWETAWAVAPYECALWEAEVRRETPPPPERGATFQGKPWALRGTR